MDSKIFVKKSAAPQKPIRQRGQVMVLFALLLPLMFIFVAVGLDIGWYYMNVSRLQSAADASAVAGARTLMESDTETFSEYDTIWLVDKYSGESIDATADDDSEVVSTDSTKSTKAATSTKSTAQSKLAEALVKCNEKATEYARKNLMVFAPNVPSLENGILVADNSDEIIDSWHRVTDDSDSLRSNKVTITPALYQDGDVYYYVVKLEEKVDHMFLASNFFEENFPLNAPVVSVAMITKGEDEDDADVQSATKDVKPTYSPVNLVFDTNGGSFDDGTTTASQKLTNPAEMEDGDVSSPLSSGKDTPTYPNGQKTFKGWSTVPNPTTDQIIDVYFDGAQLTKTELTNLFNGSDTVTLYAVWEEVKPHNNRTLWEQMQYLIAKNVYDPDWDVSTKKYGFSKLNHNSFDTINKDDLNTHHYYTEYINMAAKDANGTNLSTVNQYFIDFRRNDWLSVYRKWYYSDTNSRTHALFNVNTTYTVRSGKNDDPMYLRIEAEPGNDHYGSSYYYTPVRQFVININVSNLADNLRPLFFYYDGPDKYKSENAAPQPVILNLNADFKGVLFMPDVPVVINGNGHTFEGFIVASEFRYLDTSSGSQVKYSSNGQQINNASDNKIRVNTANGNVYTILATGADAIELYDNNATSSSKFHLSSKSKFRSFTAETGVKFNYVFYDSNLTMDSSPFYLNTGDLIPLYKLVDGKQVRLTNWDDVNLYDNPLTVSSRKLIPKKITGDENIRTVRLTNGEPSPLYDEAGNPVYFCDDYVNLTGTYTVFTLDRVADGTRDPKEFLLTKTDALNVPNTDDWK